MSTTLILYPTENGVSLVRPVDLSAPILDVAMRTVPAGVPFIFVDESELPDFEYFDAWTADFSEPDGYGIGPDVWAAEQQNASAVFTPTPEVLAASERNASRLQEDSADLLTAFAAHEQAAAERAAMLAVTEKEIAQTLAEHTVPPLPTDGENNFAE